MEQMHRFLTVFTLLDSKNDVEEGDGSISEDSYMPTDGLFPEYIRDCGDIVLTMFNRWEMP